MRFKHFLLSVAASLLLYTGTVCASAETRKELLALEQMAKPFSCIVSKIAELVSPSVVGITVGMDADTGAIRHPSMLRTGTGVIISDDGYILTSYHVIESFGAGNILVATSDSATHRVVIVGVDASSDLAVLKMEGSFESIEFADPNSVHVGDWVVAIGHHFGLQYTVSLGIVSAKGRTGILPMQDLAACEDFIQTDAAVNPGGSGGPLLNLRGELVGINDVIKTLSGGFEGVAFAVSVSIAKDISEKIIESGTAAIGYLGVGTCEAKEFAKSVGLASKDISAHFGCLAVGGVFVMEIWTDSPAYNAGVRPGDVIVELDCEAVHNKMDLQRAIRKLHVGSIVDIKIVRDKLLCTMKVAVEKQPESMSRRTCYRYNKEFVNER